MNSYNLLLNPSSNNTYEFETNYNKSGYIPYNEKSLHNRIHKQISQSPPIILCETGDSRNCNTHRHRYLFYPSIHRLSPYTEGNNILIENMNDQENRRSGNHFELEKEVNDLRNENNKIKENSLNRNEEKGGNTVFDREYKRSSSYNYNKTKGKYQDLLNKGNALMDSISDLVKSEEEKENGPLGYDNNGRILDRQKYISNLKNNDINPNENYKDNFSDINTKQGQFQSGTLGNRNFTGIYNKGSNYGNINNDENNRNYFNSDIGNYNKASYNDNKYPINKNVNNYNNRENNNQMKYNNSDYNNYLKNEDNKKYSTYNENNMNNKNKQYYSPLDNKDKQSKTNKNMNNKKKYYTDNNRGYKDKNEEYLNNNENNINNRIGSGYGTNYNDQLGKYEPLKNRESNEYNNKYNKLNPKGKNGPNPLKEN